MHEHPRPIRNLILSIFILFLALIDSAVGSWIYVPFISLLQDADIVVVAKVITIEQCDTAKHALAVPQIILKGEWPSNQMLKLQVHEAPGDVVYSTFFPITYDSAASYLLLLTEQRGVLDIIHYPHNTKILLGENDSSLIADVGTILEIDTVQSTEEQARQYSQLLGSTHKAIRESAVWKLGRLECPEALTGLVSALEDEDRMVLGSAIAGINMLGRKGITSDQAVYALEKILSYTHHTSVLIGALAAQKGHDAIPYLHNFYIFNHDYKVRESILISLSRLRDSTVVSLFRDIIYDEEISFEVANMKRTVLWCLTEPDTIPKQYPDSIAFAFAMKALDYGKDRPDPYYIREYVHIEAIQLLESRTGKSFGDPYHISGFPEDRDRVRKKIISKWKRWYKGWLRSRRLQ